MARSRKNNPAEVKNISKPDYNGKLRSKTRQILKDFINGKVDEDDLELLPEDPTEVADGFSEDKKYLKFDFRENFLDEEDEESYKEAAEKYDKSFRK